MDGRVERELSLSLEELRARPAVTHAVTLECAGNGRAALSPRPLSQPWLLEAVGTAEWTGTPLRGLLEEAGVEEGAVEVLFRGLDRGVEGGEEQHYERSLPLAEALREEVLLAYAMNGQPLPPQHGFPLRLVVPGWYGMTSVKWLDRITVARPAVRGLPAGARLPPAADAGRGGRAGVAHAAALADDPARDPRLRDPRAHARAGPVHRARAAPGRASAPSSASR